MQFVSIHHWAEQISVAIDSMRLLRLIRVRGLFYYCFNSCQIVKVISILLFILVGQSMKITCDLHWWIGAKSTHQKLFRQRIAQCAHAQLNRRIRCVLPTTFIILVSYHMENGLPDDALPFRSLSMWTLFVSASYFTCIILFAEQLLVLMVGFLLVSKSATVPRQSQDKLKITFHRTIPTSSVSCVNSIFILIYSLAAVACLDDFPESSNDKIHFVEKAQTYIYAWSKFSTKPSNLFDSFVFFFHLQARALWTSTFRPVAITYVSISIATVNKSAVAFVACCKQQQQHQHE